MGQKQQELYRLVNEWVDLGNAWRKQKTSGTPSGMPLMRSLYII